MSIIVCTYCREADLAQLLHCLARQDQRDFEVIVVDATPDPGASLSLIEEFRSATSHSVQATVIGSRKGIPVQRNAGLRHATGQIICFLDDDVTLDSSFVSRLSSIFDGPGMERVGGATGYDSLHYGAALSPRYRVRKALGYYRDLRPGALGLCDATLPLSFTPPFAGHIDVSWLPGFLMIYRREAIAGVSFDEQLTAYGAEDALFSIRIGRQWRLVMFGDLAVQHHFSPASRVKNSEAVYGASFALSRHYAARATGVGALASLGWYALVEFGLDCADLLRRPTRAQLRTVLARQTGLIRGTRSAYVSAAEELQ